MNRDERWNLVRQIEYNLAFLVFSLPMKKLLFLCALAAASLAVSAPHSLAYDPNPWHAIDRMQPELNDRYHNLLGSRERIGAGPRIQDQMAQLHFRLGRFNGLVRQRAGDPSAVRKMGEDIQQLELQVASEYDAIRRNGVPVHVYHHFW